MRTTDIEVSAAIVASTGLNPALAPHPTKPQVSIFIFPDTPEVLTAAARYASGELFLSAKHLLTCRSMLFKQLREVSR